MSETEFIAGIAVPNPGSEHNDTCQKKHAETTIHVYGDGRCFFRCIAAFLNSSFRTATRFKSGKISSASLATEETLKADSLRVDVCKCLRHHTEMLSTMSQSLQLLLDDTLHHRFACIDDRICAMEHSATYVGTVEMLAAAYLLRTQIHVYCYSSAEFKLIAKLPPNIYNLCKPVQLVYTADTPNRPGHFDLLFNEDELQLAQVNMNSEPHTTHFRDVLEDHAGMNLACLMLMVVLLAAIFLRVITILQ